jgi:hypothetical protein
VRTAIKNLTNQEEIISHGNTLQLYANGFNDTKTIFYFKSNLQLVLILKVSATLQYAVERLLAVSKPTLGTLPTACHNRNSASQ